MGGVGGHGLDLFIALVLGENLKLFRGGAKDPISSLVFSKSTVGGDILGSSLPRGLAYGTWVLS